MQLVDGIGRYSLVIEVHDLREDKVIARMPPVPIEFPQRTNRVNFFTPPMSIGLAHEGTYDLVVLADGEVIDRQRFDAKLVPTGGQSSE